MKALLLILAATGLFSCNPGKKSNAENSTNSKENKSTIDCEVALRFINDYARFCTSITPSTDDSNWIKHNPLLTDNFKITYKHLLDSAQKEDPEIGLGSDPIFDAQDFPDKGFESTECDNKSGYVTVKGKNWNDFILVLRIVFQNEKWLVDGSGIINIPPDKRAKR